MGKIIDGRAVAGEACIEIKARVKAVCDKGVQPCLAVVLVGDNPASKAYVGMKEKKAAELGIKTVGHKLPAETSEEDLISLIKQMNADDSIHGILVQLPLPKHISEDNVLMNISAAKDVDGLHPENAGMLLTGREGFIPCTPKGCVKLVESTGLKLNIQIMKIMASCPITSQQIDGETVETVADFILGGLQNHCRW